MTKNKDDRRRWEILKPVFGDVPNLSPNQIYHFEGLSAATLAKLIDEGFADPDMTQNDSPTIQGILDFLVKNRSFTAHGYVVDMGRSDAGVSVEGVYSDRAAPDEVLRFVEMFRLADEFSIRGNRCRAWYD